MKKALRLLLAFAPCLARANVVISEVLFNEVGSDVSGEWIELYNNGDAAVDMTGWRIGDEETSGAESVTEALMFFPDGATIAPGEVQIVAANAFTFAATYGFAPTYEVASGSAGDDEMVPNLSTDLEWDPDGGIINMSNSNDHVLLLDAELVPVDRVNWGNNGGLSPGLDPDAEADGQSWYRLNPSVDTDTAADWALTDLALRSTPGKLPGPTIFQAEIVDTSSGLMLRWTPSPGAFSYTVQMSESMDEWSDEALQLTSTEWLLPLPLPPRAFFRVLAD